MKRVSARKLATYEPAAVDEAIRELLHPLGGIGSFIRPGNRVLIKPNLLAGRHPDKAVTTHPSIVRAVITAVQNAGGIALVGDSPGIGSPEKVAEKAGILAAIEETGATFLPFTGSSPIHLPGKSFRELELATDVLQADCIINLPKLKTHQMMGMTCAVKNLFGTIVGMRKAQLHLRAGNDKGLFALLLLELAEYLRTSLTIVDAVVSMEGNGPGSGDPVETGFLLAGTDPVAVDTIALAASGLPESHVWTQKIALAQGRTGARLEEIELYGAPLEEISRRPLRPAPTSEINFNLPPVLHRYLKQSLCATPKIAPSSCRLCNICVDACPPHVMHNDGSRISITREECIHCFCCQELCPYGAITAHRGLLLRLADFFHLT